MVKSLIKLSQDNKKSMNERHVNARITPSNRRKGRHLEEIGKDMKAMAGLNITAAPGEDVTLTCTETNFTNKTVFEWRETGQQENEYVFLFKDNRPQTTCQDKSFKGRVFLKDPEMKNGNLSVVLKNVTSNDTGTYECRVHKRTAKSAVLESPPICISNLLVCPPGDEDKRGDLDGNSVGLRSLILSLSLLGFAAVVSVVIWIIKKKMCSNQRSGGSNNLQEDELVRLNPDSERETQQSQHLQFEGVNGVPVQTSSSV